MQSKALIYIASAVITLTAVTSNAVENGDNREKVIAELGQPVKSIKSGDYEQLVYKDLKVELLENTVVGVITPADEAPQEAAKSAADDLIALAEKKSGEKSDAESVRKNLLELKEFKSLPGYAKVDTLRKFGRKYPTANITPELLSALDALEQETLTALKESRHKELQQKINDAKYEAVMARWREDAAREDAQNLMQRQNELLLYSTMFDRYFPARRGMYSPAIAPRPIPRVNSMYPSYRAP